MGTFRLYSGDDGQSHIDSVDLSQTPEWTQARDTTHIVFREAAVGNSSGRNPGTCE